MKKLFAVLLAALMIGSTATACHKSDDPSEKDTVTGTVIETETESESESEPETETDANTEVSVDYPVDSVTIAGADLSEFRVVVSRDIPEGLVTAVHKLITCIKEATGVELELVTDMQVKTDHEIVIGDTNRSVSTIKNAVKEINNDGYAIVVKNGHLFINADTGRGVLYGICDFLENYMGVRFYTAKETYYRSIDAVTIEEGMKDVFSPVFEARRTWADQLVGNKKIEFLYFRNNSDKMSRFNVGDTEMIRVNSNHTIDNWTGTEESVVPCMSDETVYQTVLASLAKEYAKNPTQTAFQVGQGDGGTPCQCEKCSAMTEAYGTTNAAWFFFINRLADEVAELYPGVRVITYAYQFTHEVPQKQPDAPEDFPEYAVSDNVIIDFCFDNACTQHAYNDPNCEKNVPVAAEFEKWASMCKAGNLYVYEYAWNEGGGILPDPNLFVMWDNFHYFVEQGVSGALGEGVCSDGGEFDHLRHYLRTKLTWNPNMTEEEYYALMDEFMADYYGDAAPIMKQYMEILYDKDRVACTEMYTPWWTFFPKEMVDGKYDTTLVDQCLAMFDQAMAMETLTDAQRDHVEYVSLHVLWAKLDMTTGRERQELTTHFDELAEKHQINRG